MRYMLQVKNTIQSCRSTTIIYLIQSLWLRQRSDHGCEYVVIASNNNPSFNCDGLNCQPPKTVWRKYLGSKYGWLPLETGEIAMALFGCEFVNASRLGLKMILSGTRNLGFSVIDLIQHVNNCRDADQETARLCLHQMPYLIESYSCRVLPPSSCHRRLTIVVLPSSTMGFSLRNGLLE